MNDFNSWNTLKQKLDNKNTVPFFKDREVWWCSIGHNIGHEENGKNNNFERPVIVIKKFNNRLFWGVPLTTQIKVNKHYYKFEFQNKIQCAMLTQIRLWDANRLTRRKGRIASVDHIAIKDNLTNYLK
jgi:mRNA interferase MazF